MPAKRMEMYYGESGTGKSEAIARVIKLMAEQAGIRARVLIGDGSRATYEAAGLIDSGIVDIVDYSNRPFPQSTLEKLLEGWWPEDVDDVNSPLIPPSTPKKTTPNVLTDFGIYALEGLTVMGFYLMGDQPGGYAWRAARGEKIGMDTPIRVGDGEYKTVGGKQIFVPAFEGAGEFGTNNPAHYGFAQKRLAGLVQRAKMLPMEYVMWSAHQRAVEDKVSHEVIFGPEVPGSALTLSLQRDFNNTWHFENPAVRGKATEADSLTGKIGDRLKSEYRVYFRDHYTANPNITLKFKAVTRGAPANFPEYLTGEPGEAVEEAYMILKKLGAERAKASKEKFDAARAARAGAAA